MITKNINNLICQPNTFKDYNHEIKTQVINSLKKYGQLKPLLIQGNTVIEGRLLYECLKQAGFNNVLCIELDTELTKLQLFDLQLKLNVSGDMNILQLGQQIIDQFGDLPIQEIAAETGLQVHKIAALKAILDVKYKQTEAEHKAQPKLF